MEEKDIQQEIDSDTSPDETVSQTEEQQETPVSDDAVESSENRVFDGGRRAKAPPPFQF